MDIFTIGGLVAAGIALFGAGHWHGSASAQALLAKVKADFHGAVSAVSADARAAAQQVGQMPVGQATSGFLQAVEHPVTTIEHELALHHLTSIRTAVKALWDDSAALAKIEAAQAEIDFKNTIRGQVADLVPGVLTKATTAGGTA